MYFSPLDGLMFEKENFFKRSRIGNRVSAYCPWLAKPMISRCGFWFVPPGCSRETPLPHQAAGSRWPPIASSDGSVFPP